MIVHVETTFNYFQSMRLVITMILPKRGVLYKRDVTLV